MSLPAWDDSPIEFTKPWWLLKLESCLLTSKGRWKRQAEEKETFCVFVAWDSPGLACGACCIHLSEPGAGDGSVQIPALPVSATFAPFLKSWRKERKANLRTRYYLGYLSGLLAPALWLHPAISSVQANPQSQKTWYCTTPTHSPWDIQLCNCSEWLTSSIVPAAFLLILSKRTNLVEEIEREINFPFPTETLKQILYHHVHVIHYVSNTAHHSVTILQQDLQACLYYQ